MINSKASNEFESLLRIIQFSCFSDAKQTEEFHSILRQIFQLNLNYSQKSELIERLDENQNLAKKCILLFPQNDHFEQKYDFSFNYEHPELYSNFKFGFYEESQQGDIDFLSDQWDYFKTRIFSILFSSQNLVYDVVDILKEEMQFRQFSCQQKSLYFFAYLSKFTSKNYNYQFC